MYTILTTDEAVGELLDDDNAAWSRAGAVALIEHLEALEFEMAGETMGTKIEFDRVAIRCDYSEYSGVVEAAREYDCDCTVNIFNDDGTEDEDYVSKLVEECLQWLQDRTDVIVFDGGVIIRQF